MPFDTLVFYHLKTRGKGQHQGLDEEPHLTGQNINVKQEDNNMSNIKTTSKKKMKKKKKKKKKNLTFFSPQKEASLGFWRVTMAAIVPAEAFQAPSEEDATNARP